VKVLTKSVCVLGRLLGGEFDNGVKQMFQKNISYDRNPGSVFGGRSPTRYVIRLRNSAIRYLYQAVICIKLYHGHCAKLILDYL